MGTCVQFENLFSVVDRKSLLTLESAPVMADYLNTADAGQRFPSPISSSAVLHRMKTGMNGIKLQFVFDGFKFYTTAEWVDEFIQKVTESRGKSPAIERLDDSSVARFKALIRRKTQSRV
jgi:hypothetical protein